MFSRAQELQLLHEEPANASAASELRVVKSQLWDAIAANLNVSEGDEVRRVIGNSRLDENESLFAEATALADILGEVQLNTKELLARHSLCRNVQRNMVESEVRLLMERLRTLAVATPFTGSAIKVRDPESVVPKAAAKDKSVFDYLAVSSSLALDGLRTPFVRPTTASSLSRPTTSSSLSRPSTACSGGSNSQAYDASAIVSSMQDKLNVYEIDAVKDALRVALEEEKAYLMEDIEYLTALLTDEAEMQSQAAVPPPSLNDLKEYCLKLQDAVASEEARHEHEMRVSHMFAAAAVDSSKAARLRGMISASRKTQPQSPLQRQETHGCSDGDVHANSVGVGNGSDGGGQGRGDGQPQQSMIVPNAENGARGVNGVIPGPVGAAKRLANARSAVERALPLLSQQQQQQPLQQGSSAHTGSAAPGGVVGHSLEAYTAEHGAARREVPSRKGNVPVQAASSGTQCAPGACQALLVPPEFALRSPRLTGKFDQEPASVQGHTTSRGPVPAAHSNDSRSSPMPSQAATAALSMSQQHGQCSSQGSGCAVGSIEHGLPAGRLRPSSAARLKALVANPSGLPPQHSSMHTHFWQHADARNGSAGGKAGSVSALKGNAVSGADNVSNSTLERGNKEQCVGTGRHEGSYRDVASSKAESADIDSKVGRLKGGVAAILKKHGLQENMARAKDQTPACRTQGASPQ